VSRTGTAKDLALERGREKNAAVLDAHMPSPLSDCSFVDECNDSSHYRPETPANEPIHQGHKLEAWIMSTTDPMERKARRSASTTVRLSTTRRHEQ
jgi:hypothetical protein